MHSVKVRPRRIIFPCLTCNYFTEKLFSKHLTHGRDRPLQISVDHLELCIRLKDVTYLLIILFLSVKMFQ